MRVTLPRNGAHAYSFFQDHPFAGIGAGTVAGLCMNPLNLLNVKFQVSTRGPEGGIRRGIWRALCDVQANEGWRGLWYRGSGPNVAENASSWGLYFFLSCASALFLPLHRSNLNVLICSYNRLKRRALTRQIGPVGFLIPAFSTEASSHPFNTCFPTPLTNRVIRLGAVTAILTKPIR